MRTLTTDILGRVHIGDDQPDLPAGYHVSPLQRRTRPASRAARTQISKPEYALITVAVAQKLTGSATATPTAKQIAEAQKQTQAAVLKAGVGVKGGTAKIDKLFNKARNELSGICGMSGDECGGLWDALKDAVVKSAPAMPFIGPAAGLLMATAPLIARQNQKAKRKPQPAPESQQAQPAQGAPAGQPPAQSAQTQPAQPAQQDDVDPVNAQIVGESITSTYDRALARLSGDDVLVYGEGGGSSELGAARRRRRNSKHGHVPMSLGDDVSTISPTAYRMAVIQRATKLAGGGKPETRHMYVAQKTVDRDLDRGSISVQIPGAAPGRVTR